MNIRIYLLLLVVAIICSGCGVSGVTSITDRGDSVTNQAGLGTGTVAGVNIRVLGLKQKNAAVTHSVKIVEGAESTTESDRWEVEFGEVKLILASDKDQPMSLTIDGVDYGAVAKDDHLLIDAARKVTVNGEERLTR